MQYLNMVLGWTLLQTREDSTLWKQRQSEVRKAFKHAWSGYKQFAMGYDELQPVGRVGTDGLGGLGATVIDALDTAMIMGLGDVVEDAGSWIQKNLLERMSVKGQVIISTDRLCEVPPLCIF